MSNLVKGKCISCDGTGYQPCQYYGGSVCYECDGTGLILTDRGEEIMILINAAMNRLQLERRQDRESDRY